MQKIIDNTPEALDAYFTQTGAKKVFLVGGKSMDKLKIGEYFSKLEERTGINVVRFSDFKPNPGYESVLAGVKLFRESGCDMIAAVGGGSAMDTAKCIKMYATMDDSTDHIKQEIVPNDMEFLAVPTTAGTGSEATRYSIIYYNGVKTTVTDDSSIPTAVLFDPDTLRSLPDYQKKATMLDALCHAVESYWSVHSTDESKAFAAQAIKLIFAAKDGYLANTDEGNSDMLKAANIAGKAINITATTAGHAMCYKLTSDFGLAHGHASALCVKVLFPYMVQNTHLCTDERGEGYFVEMLDELAEVMGCDTPMAAAEKFWALIDELGMEVPAFTEKDLEKLAGAVNTDRLKNHPISLEPWSIKMLYGRM
ncbi:phosphonoacetaldehyde reductase [Ruminococcus sp.]|uniref:phosphonoacetaldehyde reductase n=1 Tax=Ruminococcus sp. TaxID=41978 RepID=UPI0025F58FAB|nr:phosphonoacetaldehyde reductase [Ruminococcus sp.]MBQ8965713.1 phosphonoacetaldehyde reductase [Ruminococcus sp.]MBQ8968105.1 phosphonoacetaldehyde reductase [Ruminococcus sp.]